MEHREGSMRYCTRGYTNASARKITDDKGSGQPILEHTSLGDRRTAEKNKGTLKCPAPSALARARSVQDIL